MYYLLLMILSIIKFKLHLTAMHHNFLVPRTLHRNFITDIYINTERLKTRLTIHSANGHLRKTI